MSVIALTSGFEKLRRVANQVSKTKCLLKLMERSFHHTHHFYFTRFLKSYFFRNFLFPTSHNSLLNNSGYNR